MHHSVPSRLAYSTYLISTPQTRTAKLGARRKRQAEHEARSPRRGVPQQWDTLAHVSVKAQTSIEPIFRLRARAVSVPPFLLNPALYKVHVTPVVVVASGTNATPADVPRRVSRARRQPRPSAKREMR